MKPGYTGPQTEAEFIAEVKACPRAHGWMGGGTVGGGDPDDADREPEMVQVRISIELLDEDGELDESINAQSQDMDREKACGAIRRLREEWHRAISDEPSPMITVDDVADNYARGRDDERSAIASYYAELFQRAPFSVGDMLSDIRRNQHQKERID